MKENLRKIKSDKALVDRTRNYF